MYCTSVTQVPGSIFWQSSNTRKCQSDNPPKHTRTNVESLQAPHLNQHSPTFQSFVISFLFCITHNCLYVLNTVESTSKTPTIYVTTDPFTAETPLIKSPPEGHAGGSAVLAVDAFFVRPLRILRTESTMTASMPSFTCCYPVVSLHL